MATSFITDIAWPYQKGLQLSRLGADVVGAQIKCTQGRDYANPQYPAWLAQARAAHLIATAYHYVDGAAPAAQAANLAAHIVDRSLPVMIDSERGGGNLPHVLEVIDAISAAGLRPKIDYLPRSWWQQIGSPHLAPLTTRGILLANAAYPKAGPGTAESLYPGDGAPGWAPYGPGEPAPVLYQFTDAALEDGQGVDMAAYRGTPAQLAALLGAPAPVLAPQASAPRWDGRTLIYHGAGAKPTAGADVRAWQTHMRLRGWTIAVDGIYGAQSAGVCRAFQIDSNAHGWPLDVDAKVGQHTWDATWSRPVSR